MGRRGCHRGCLRHGSGPSPFLAQELLEWVHAGSQATDLQLDEVDWQADAVCYVMTQIARRVGDGGMRAALGAMIGGELAYRSEGVVLSAASDPVTWRGWLDALDELGLVPAGEPDLDYTQNLLAHFRGARATSQFPARTEARAGFHALEDEVGGWAPRRINATLDGAALQGMIRIVVVVGLGAIAFGVLLRRRRAASVALGVGTEVALAGIDLAGRAAAAAPGITPSALRTRRQHQRPRHSFRYLRSPTRHPRHLRRIR